MGGLPPSRLFQSNSDESLDFSSLLNPSHQQSAGGVSSEHSLFTSHQQNVLQNQDTDFKCPHCYYLCDSEAKLVKHIKTNHVAKKCQYCNYSSLRIDHLKIHVRSHTGEKPYSCLKCNRKFTQKSHLNVHNHKYHPEIAIANNSMFHAL